MRSRADQYAGWVLMGVVAYAAVVLIDAWAMPIGPGLAVLRDPSQTSCLGPAGAIPIAGAVR